MVTASLGGIIFDAGSPVTVKDHVINSNVLSLRFRRGTLSIRINYS